ncbi:MAG: hypothetical protein D6820_12200, partial [Lentisphaerae bacterium]
SGTISLQVAIGSDDQQQDRFHFTVFPESKPVEQTLEVFDPIGETSRWLRSLGYRPLPVKGMPAGKQVVIGRKVLSSGFLLPFDAANFVQRGGSLLVMAQDPQWLHLAWGMRISRHQSRYVFAVNPNHPIMRGLKEEDLQLWAGESQLQEPYPLISNGVEPWFNPLYGWRWGSRNCVASFAIEKPHFSGWRPILECEFDLAYSPLLELCHGSGRILLCTLDLEDHTLLDPGARRLAFNLLTWFKSSSIPPHAMGRTLLVGDCNPWARYLRNCDQSHNLPDTLKPYSIVVIGRDAVPSIPRLIAYARQGGKVVVLPRTRALALPGVRQVEQMRLRGMRALPGWTELKGLSVSDVRARAFYAGQTYVTVTGAEPKPDLANDGLLARWKVGKGTLLAVQLDPAGLPEKTHFRLTRWRYTRTVSQILANLGAIFSPDLHWLRLLNQPNPAIPLAGVWDAVATVRIPEAIPRKPHRDPGLSQQGRKLLGLQIPQQILWQKVYVPAYWESYGPDFRFIDGEMV